jgi:hypothetical protein
MAITKEEAIQKAINLLSSSIDESRLEIVDRISGCLYGESAIDIENSGIIYVHSDECRVDGPEQYILVDKKTGTTTEVKTG